MKITKFITFYFLSVILVSNSCSQDALLDYAKVFLLHPKIVNYHFGLNTFYKDSTTMEKRIEIGNKLQDINNQSIKEFKVGSQILRDQYQLDKYSLNVQAQNNKNKDGNRKYFALLEQITVLKDQLIDKQNTLKQLMQENRAKSISQYFVSSNERNKIFYSISKEIRSTVNDLKKLNNYQNIFQGTDKLKLPIKTVDYSKLPLGQLPFVTIDNFFVAFIADSKSIGTLIDDHKQYEGVTKDKFVNQTEHESLDYYLQSYLHSNPFPPVSGQTQNISYQVLKSLYDKYQIPTVKLDNSYAK